MLKIAISLAIVTLIRTGRASDEYSEMYPEEAYAGDYGLKKVVSYAYEVNDYNGNEQSKKETIDGATAKGQYKTRMPDGKLQVVTYDSGPYGHLADVKYHDQPDVHRASTRPPARPYHAASTLRYPQHDDQDVRQVVSYEYAINDHKGNEQSKTETIDGTTAKGEYRTRMPDGQLQVVTYESGPGGHLANVKYEPADEYYADADAAAPLLYGTGGAKSALYYGAVKPYVRTSTDVKYIRTAARPPSRPYHRTSPTTFAKPVHETTTYTAYQPAHQVRHGPRRPIYTSPSLPPYPTYHESYRPRYTRAQTID